MIREDEKGELLYEVDCAGSLSIEFTKEELEGMIHELEVVGTNVVNLPINLQYK